jgi:hypothetical protein
MTKYCFRLLDVTKNGATYSEMVAEQSMVKMCRRKSSKARIHLLARETRNGAAWCDRERLVLLVVAAQVVLERRGAID